MKLIDISGKRFGSWTVLSKAKTPRGARNAYWLCRCECGTVRSVDGVGLRRGTTTSCGCQTGAKISAAVKKHGMGGTRTHRIWSGMLDRCRNPRSRDFANWGGRGIRVCERWLRFENFLADMGEAPAGLTIDRINNDGNYEPGNCRWATQVEQQNNSRNNRRISFGGRSLTVTQWANELGMKPATLFSRLDEGWPAELALTRPTQRAGFRPGNYKGR